MFGIQGPLSKWIIDGTEAVSNAKDTPDVLNAANKRLKELFVEVDPEIKRLEKLQKENLKDVFPRKSHALQGQKIAFFFKVNHCYG